MSYKIPHWCTHTYTHHTQHTHTTHSTHTPYLGQVDGCNSPLVVSSVHLATLWSPTDVLHYPAWQNGRRVVSLQATRREPAWWRWITLCSSENILTIPKYASMCRYMSLYSIICDTFEVYTCDIVRWLRNHRNLTIVRWSDICHIDFWGKMASFWEAFLGKRFVCCALIVLYSIYSTVGQSIASISDLGGIFTSGLIYRL